MGLLRRRGAKPTPWVDGRSPAPLPTLPPGTFADVVLLVSGFGEDGRGGIFLFDGERVEAVDRFGTTGVAYGDGRVGRLLRAADEYESVGEFLVYDETGVLEYRRLDDLVDPHGLARDSGTWLMVSSARNAVMRLEPDGKLHEVWRPTPIHDAWHPNCLEVVAGDVWVTAFGRFDKSRGWRDSSARRAGFLRNLRTGAEFGGLTHPHSPRLIDDSWWVCESLDRQLVALEASTGQRTLTVTLDGYTRGLAWADDVVFVGVSSDRQGPVWRDATVAVVSRRGGGVLGRIPVPALEIFDLVLVPSCMVPGLRRGFDTNPQRVAEQQSRRIWDGLGSAGADLHRLGLPLPLPQCRTRIECDATPEGRSGLTEVVKVKVVNNGSVPLASVPPYPVYLSYRWFDGSGRPIEGIRAPLGRLLLPGDETVIALPVQAPSAPGRYRLTVALVQEQVCWLTDVDAGNGWTADIEVLPACG